MSASDARWLSDYVSPTQVNALIPSNVDRQAAAHGLRPVAVKIRQKAVEVFPNLLAAVECLLP